MATDEKSLLLVSGYMREGELVVRKVSTNVIPQSLVQICCKFYVHSIDKFVHHRVGMANIYNPSGSRFSPLHRFVSLSIHRTVIDTEHIIQFGDTASSRDILSDIRAPFCYVPNLSWSLPSPRLLSAKPHFDGILGLYTDNTHFDYRPCFILFNPSEAESGSTDIAFSRFLSSQPFPSCTMSNQYLFCGSKHGIISEESDGRLYQLKLADISSRHFRFKLMENMEYGSSQRICYLSRTESIFAIQSQKHSMNLSKVQCKSYSLQTRKWRQLVDDKFIHSQPAECGICSNVQEDNVYLVDGSGRIAMFDLHSLKWTYLSDKMRTGKEQQIQGSKASKVPPTVWFDGEHSNLLYAMSTGNSPLSKYTATVRFFDLRNRRAEWKDIATQNGPYSQLHMGSRSAIF